MRFFRPGGKTAVSVLYARGAMKPSVIHFLRTHEIRGAKLWDLFKNVCSQDEREFVDLVNELVSTNNPQTITHYSRMEEEDVNVMDFLRRFE